jgi:hypothetical protein
MMAVCPVKKFTPELIRVYERRILKRLAWTPAGEIRRMEESRELPVCVRLFAGAVLHDLDAGRFDTLNHPEFRASTVKLWEKCYAKTFCEK